MKTIDNGRKVGGDNFHLKYSRKSNKYLDDYLPLFNFEDYWCFKSTNKQRLVDYQEFIEFKYSGYIFFRKDLYDIDHILKWVEWNSVVFNGDGIQYLSKPLPPFNTSKIIVKK